ncbi:MAG: hypothetical protein M1817_000890 [Caeruleum heppii]|nr:MAG: hypothetical protein M1817_000890 [Caeruleum heppii]
MATFGRRLLPGGVEVEAPGPVVPAPGNWLWRWGHGPSLPINATIKGQPYSFNGTGTPSIPVADALTKRFNLTPWEHTDWDQSVTDLAQLLKQMWDKGAFMVVVDLLFICLLIAGLLWANQNKKMEEGRRTTIFDRAGGEEDVTWEDIERERAARRPRSRSRVHDWLIVFLPTVVMLGLPGSLSAYITRGWAQILEGLGTFDPKAASTAKVKQMWNVVIPLTIFFICLPAIFAAFYRLRMINSRPERNMSSILKRQCWKTVLAVLAWNVSWWLGTVPLLYLRRGRAVFEREGRAYDSDAERRFINDVPKMGVHLMVAFAFFCTGLVCLIETSWESTKAHRGRLAPRQPQRWSCGIPKFFTSTILNLFRARARRGPSEQYGSADAHPNARGIDSFQMSPSDNEASEVIELPSLTHLRPSSHLEKERAEGGQPTESIGQPRGTAFHHMESNSPQRSTEQGQWREAFERSLNEYAVPRSLE